jgi:hypothetical protein
VRFFAPTTFLAMPACPARAQARTQVLTSSWFLWAISKRTRQSSIHTQVFVLEFQIEQAADLSVMKNPFLEKVGSKEFTGIKTRGYAWYWVGYAPGPAFHVNWAVSAR